MSQDKHDSSSSNVELLLQTILRNCWERFNSIEKHSNKRGVVQIDETTLSHERSKKISLFSECKRRRRRLIYHSRHLLPLLTVLVTRGKHAKRNSHLLVALFNTLFVHEFAVNPFNTTAYTGTTVLPLICPSSVITDWTGQG